MRCTIGRAIARVARARGCRVPLPPGRGRHATVLAVLQPLAPPSEAPAQPSVASSHDVASPVDATGQTAHHATNGITHRQPQPHSTAVHAAAAAAALAAAPPALQQQAGGGGGGGALGGLLARFPIHLDGRLRGLVMLNVMTLIMSSNWIVVKNASEATLTDSTVFMTLRFALGAALFSPFLRGADSRIIKAGATVGCWYAAGYVGQALALASTAASRASLLSTFTVLGVPIIAGLGGQHIRPIVWGCAAAALAGTAMLEGGSSLGPPNAGDAWAVASAVLFAFQTITAEKNVRTLPPRSELPLMAVSMVTVALFSAVATATVHAADGSLGHAAEGVQRLFADWRALLPSALGGGGGAGVPAAEAAEAVRTAQQLVWTALISTNLVLLIELYALQDVSSTDAAMIYSMEPVLGALLAYAFLGERWGPWGWAGGGVVMAASLLTQMAGAVEADDSAKGGGGGGEGGK